MKNTAESVAIYWGAFNPPTIGHKEVIDGVLEQGIVDRIIFTPDGMRKDKNYGTPPEKRREIIEIFFEELKAKHGEKIQICRYFLNKCWTSKNISIPQGHLETRSSKFFKCSETTTTRDVDRYFQNELWFSPYHIFGSDVAQEMKNWLNNDDEYIEKTLKKLFIGRPGYDFIDDGLENYILADIPDLTEVSSTTVREMLKNKIAVDALLTPWVHSYIQQEI